MKYTALLLLSACLVFTACKDDDDVKITDPDVKITDTEKPVIDLVAPAANTSLLINHEPVLIKGSVTDNVEIAQVKIELTYITFGGTDQQLFLFTLNPDSTSTAFDTTYTIHTNDHSDYRVRVQATDKAGNTATTDRHFHVMP